MQAAASLSHPHIVTAHDAEEAAGTHFLVMEFVDGEPLDSWLAQSSARGEKLPVPEACAYVRQAALGLQVAHEKGMVHRDIKPHNLMRTREGAVKILDFGLARVIREAVQGPGELITAEGTVMGTADYMAPEQGRDSHRADIRADIYSLGCSLYHLLSGSVPFPQGTTIVKILKHTMARPEPLSSFRQDLPVGLVQIVEKMMAKKPEDRYQTPGEVATALEPFCIAGFAEKGDAPRPIGNLPSGSYDAASRDFPSWRRGITWKLMFAIPVIGALAMLLLALLLLRLGV
jgi:serine/threonine protein kinase